MIDLPAPAKGTAMGWHAGLRLGYEKRGGVTVLSENRHVGPLRVQLPLYPEGEVCHTCILHPPGGVVAGDRLEVWLTCADGSHVLVTTPGATKFYRSGGKIATQRQLLRVQGGVLEWFPQDNIIFPGAIADIGTEIRLGSEARFIGWEVLCLGLPSRVETLSEGILNSRLSLYRNDQPLFVERLAVSGMDDLNSPAGLRGRPVVATFLATGVDKPLPEDLRKLQQTGQQNLVGFTLLGDLLIGRYLGDSTFEAREIFQEAWSILRPLLLGRQACPPRIWST